MSRQGCGSLQLVPAPLTLCMCLSRTVAGVRLIVLGPAGLAEPFTKTDIGVREGSMIYASTEQAGYCFMAGCHVSSRSTLYVM